MELLNITEARNLMLNLISKLVNIQLINVTVTDSDIMITNIMMNNSQRLVGN